MSSLIALLVGAVSMVAGPVLAGAGGAGAWAISIFAVIAVVSVVLVLSPEAWATPFHLAAFSAADAVFAALLFVLGRWLSSALEWHPTWGALPPILLSAAGAGLLLSLRPASKP